MAQTTAKAQLPYPQATDPNNVPADMQALATRLDALPGVENLTNAQRNALAAAQKWDGRVIYNTDLKLLQRWSSDSASWLSVGSYGSGTLASRPAAAAQNAGMIYEVTDGRIWSISTGAAWVYLNSVTTMDTTQRNALIAGSVFAGRIIYNTTTAQHESYNGTAWVAVGGSSGYADVLMLGGA